MSCIIKCCAKAPLETEQTPAPQANHNRLISVIPKMAEEIDIFYEWIGPEPKIKAVVANLAEIDLDNRVIEETPIILAKLKIERLFARSQMISQPFESSSFVYCKAPESFKSTNTRGTCAEGKYKWAASLYKKDHEPTEDRFVAEEFILEADDKQPIRVQLFAVYVGHCGMAAVDYTADNFALELQVELDDRFKTQEKLTEKEIFNSIVKASVMTDSNFKRDKTSRSSGCEMSGVILIEDTIWPFNLGGAKTDLLASQYTEQLTEIATMEDERYHRAILRRASQLEGDWITPRSIGDRQLIACSARPKVYDPVSIAELPQNSRIMISSKPLAILSNCVKLLKQLNSEPHAADLAKNMVYSAAKTGVTAGCTSLVVELK